MEFGYRRTVAPTARPRHDQRTPRASTSTSTGSDTDCAVHVLRASPNRITQNHMYHPSLRRAQIAAPALFSVYSPVVPASQEASKLHVCILTPHHEKPPNLLKAEMKKNTERRETRIEDSVPPCPPLAASRKPPRHPGEGDTGLLHPFALLPSRAHSACQARMTGSRNSNRR